jgi:uncharacterized integral membrane protein (TIGR00698 family)
MQNWFRELGSARLLFVGCVLVVLSPLGSSALALLLGVGLALTFGNPWIEQTKKLTPRLLSYSIVGLGAGMNLVTVAQAGMAGLGYTAVSIILTLGLGLALGRWLKSERETSILISVGTAICGGSAIAAVAPVIRAKPQVMTVALGTVFILNAVALLLFPVIGHAMGLSQNQFGIWSALAIHDTSSVVGAGLKYGVEALRVGTTVKLARALWIVPLTFAFAFVQNAEAKNDAISQDKTSFSRVKKPWFILGFVLMAGIATWLPVMLSGAGTVAILVEALARKGLVLTLFFIGANLSLATLKEVGLRPFLQGLTLWLSVLVVTLLFVKTCVN